MNKWGVLLLPMLAVGLVGCNPLDLLGDDALPPESGRIAMRQSGGFAGVLTDYIAEVRDGRFWVEVRDERQGRTLAGELSQNRLTALWTTLRDNDVFRLGDNDDLTDRLADGFFYEVTVELGERRNRFSVYAPEALESETGEGRYAAIVDAIRALEEATTDVIEPLPVESVSLQIMESFPVQVALEVEGILRDSCTELHEMAQAREGNAVTVSITTIRPKEALCAEVVTMITHRVKLDGTFPPGRYTVTVNGVERAFET